MEIRKLRSDVLIALKKLIKLDYEAIESYSVAIPRLENAAYRSILEEFKIDHQRHIIETSKFLKLYNEIPPKGPSAKILLAQSKLIFANLSSDKAILQAMRNNEIGIRTAYVRINDYEEIPDTLKRTLQQGLQDEKCHLIWIEGKLG